MSSVPLHMHTWAPVPLAHAQLGAGAPCTCTPLHTWHGLHYCAARCLKERAIWKTTVLGRKVTPSKYKEIDPEVGYGHSPHYDGSTMLMSRPGKIPCARAFTKTRAFHKLIHPALHVQGFGAKCLPITVLWHMPTCKKTAITTYFS